MTLAKIVVLVICLILFQKFQVRWAAKRTLARMKKTYAGAHDYADADPRDYHWLDLNFYDQAARDFSQRGYTWLADLEDLTTTATYPTLRTFVRSWSGQGAAVVAGAYFARPTTPFSLLGFLTLVGIMPKIGGVIDFETAFSDGHFVGTTMGSMLASRVDYPPEIHMHFLPPGTTLDGALQVHWQRITQYLASHPGVAILPVASREQLIAFQHATQEIKARFRRERGFISRAELHRMAGPGSQGAALAVSDEIEKIQKDEERR